MSHHCWCEIASVYLDALLLPSTSIDEPTAIYGIRRECHRIDSLLLGATERPGPKFGLAANQLIRYSAFAVVIGGLAIGGYTSISGQLSEVSERASGLNTRVEELLGGAGGRGDNARFLGTIGDC